MLQNLLYNIINKIQKYFTKKIIIVIIIKLNLNMFLSSICLLRKQKGYPFSHQKGCCVNLHNIHLKWPAKTRMLMYCSIKQWSFRLTSYLSVSYFLTKKKLQIKNNVLSLRINQKKKEWDDLGAWWEKGILRKKKISLREYHWPK